MWILQISISKIIKQNSDSFHIKFENDNIIITMDNDKTLFDAEFRAVHSRIPNGKATYQISYKNFLNIKTKKDYKYPTCVERFWIFAKEKLLRYRGSDQKYLYLYLKEIEFRYNNRSECLFDKIMQKLSFC